MLCKDEWLSQYFKGGAYSCKKPFAQTPEEIKKGFIYAKISIQDFNSLPQLLCDGFHFIEISAFFKQQSLMQYDVNEKNNIGFATKNEKEAVLEISENTF